MKICGIVAEYNPFHNGHKYQIEEIKKETRCDTVVAVMSGNFLQRGIPASFDKWTRAKMAIENGVDVVIELPTCYATASSEFFSLGAIGILEKLGCVSNISFGAMCDDLGLLLKISDTLYKEPKKYKELLQKELKNGSSFPKARSNALCEFLSNSLSIKKNELETILLDPNNILAIEYLKALKKYKSKITPFVVKRKGTSYNSLELNKKENICSSTAIREVLSSDSITKIKKFVPNSTYELIKNELKIDKKTMELYSFEHEIFYKLRSMSKEELKEILDVEEGFENTIAKALMNSVDINSLINNLKSKRYTQTRIQRILIHSLLDIKTKFLKEYKNKPQYARVLAISKNGKKILSEISKNSKIPIITNVAKFMKESSKNQKEMLGLDILATNVYTLGYNNKKYRNNNLDYTMPIIK